MKKFTAYEWESRKPERQFFSEPLRAAHETFLASVQRFMSRTAVIMVLNWSGSKLVIRAKAEGEKRFVEDYDEWYDQQADEVEQLTKSVWIAWQAFIKLAAVAFIS